MAQFSSSCLAVRMFDSVTQEIIFSFASSRGNSAALPARPPWLDSDKKSNKGRCVRNCTFTVSSLLGCNFFLGCGFPLTNKSDNSDSDNGNDGNECGNSNGNDNDYNDDDDDNNNNSNRVLLIKDYFLVFGGPISN